MSLIHWNKILSWPKILCQSANSECGNHSFFLFKGSSPILNKISDLTESSIAETEVFSMHLYFLTSFKFFLKVTIKYRTLKLLYRQIEMILFTSKSKTLYSTSKMNKKCITALLKCIYFTACPCDIIKF